MGKKTVNKMLHRLGSSPVEKVYIEDKSLWLTWLMFWGIINSIFGGVLCSAPSAPPEFKFYFLVPIWLLITYGYFKCRNREYWVKLEEENLKFFDSAGKGLATYRYNDIRRIENYAFGFTLKFKKGCPVQRVQIGTSSFKNGCELKAELRQRWMQANG